MQIVVKVVISRDRRVLHVKCSQLTGHLITASEGGFVRRTIDKQGITTVYKTQDQF